MCSEAHRRAVNVQQSNIGLVMMGETAGHATRQATRQLAINEAEKKLECKVRRTKESKEATNSFATTLQWELNLLLNAPQHCTRPGVRNEL